uniref:R3H domain-containing protein n=1 Tax=Palpitomonas bilix TaxID=652834 RepID=A0A7S3DER7_9EUKA
MPPRVSREDSIATESDDLSLQNVDHLSFRDLLIAKIKHRKLDCAVCYDRIGSGGKIWNCSSCHNIFHLSCIQRWGAKTSAEGTFSCPTCQYLHLSPSMRKYVCFCGKRENPDDDPSVLPHSCGEVCGKRLKPVAGAGTTTTSGQSGEGGGDGVESTHAEVSPADTRLRLQCPHHCSLLCHPGPCPGCNRLHPDPVRCHCGRNSCMRRCGELNTPFECGEVCGKMLRCGKHKCEQSCHAGPCPPCTRQEPQKCFCGSTAAMKPCGDGLEEEKKWEERRREQLAKTVDDIMLDQFVRLSLNHSGREAEGEEGKGVSKARIPSRFSCGRVCDKPLPCGLHTCESVCHRGPCLPCPLDPTFSKRGRRCGCGKVCAVEDVGVTRSACTDELKSCGGVCGRLYLCRAHSCDRTCHDGPCDSKKHAEYLTLSDDDAYTARLEHLDKPMVGCSGEQDLSCRCGTSSIRLPCKVIERIRMGKAPLADEQGAGEDDGSVVYAFDVPVRMGRELKMNKMSFVTHKDDPSAPIYFVCASVCGMKRTCGKHRCSTRCCIHKRLYQGREGRERAQIPCPLTCNKQLRCGNHRCQLPCHAGPCIPCMEISFEEYRCPCGRTVMEPPIPCGAKLPECPYTCTLERECGHRDEHPCHPRSEPCPPCMAFIWQTCACGGAAKEVRCSQRNMITCGKPCKKTLPCGMHACTRHCHEGECQPFHPRCVAPHLLGQEENNGSGGDVEAEHRRATAALQRFRQGTLQSKTFGGPDAGGGCGHRCVRDRQCGHRCQYLCHPALPCPDVDCNAVVDAVCDCGRIHRKVKCCELSTLPKPVKFPVPTPARLLYCDDDCARLKRDRDLALALGIVNTAMKPVGYSATSHHTGGGQGGSRTHEGEEPLAISGPLPISESLYEMSRKEDSFVREVEVKMQKLIDDATMRLVRFPPMPRPKRRVVHELAALYGLDSISYDPEPQRHVEVMRSSSSRRPFMSSFVADFCKVTERGAQSAATAATSAPGKRSLVFYDLEEGTTPEAIERQLFEYADDVAVHWRGERPRSSDDYKTGRAQIIATFRTQSACQRAMASLGGGQRGSFRVRELDTGSVTTLGPSEGEGSSAGSSGMWMRAKSNAAPSAEGPAWLLARRAMREEAAGKTKGEGEGAGSESGDSKADGAWGGGTASTSKNWREDVRSKSPAADDWEELAESEHESSSRLGSNIAVHASASAPNFVQANRFAFISDAADEWETIEVEEGEREGRGGDGEEREGAEKGK